MNCWATIAQDPYMKAAFFLSLMDGPKVEGWTQCTYDWLDQVKTDPSLLPFKMNAWQALEADFKQYFIDYAEHEWAQDELRKLKMKDSNVDEYIATFQLLGHHAGMNLDNPSTLQLFAWGLPKSLTDSCIDIDSPKNFEQWANAAQWHHRNYLKKLAVHQDYTSPHPQTNSNQGQFFWCHNQKGNMQPARPRLPPVTPMLWTPLLLHARQSPKQIKRNTEQKDIALNVPNKGIWPKIAQSDPTNQHECVQWKLLMWWK
jgi:hypothetical protein